MFGRKGLTSKSDKPAPKPSFLPGKTMAIAARYVGVVAPPGVFIVEIFDPKPCETPSGKIGRRYRARTEDGEAVVFFFDDHASVWVSNEPQPRPAIPTEMIANRVRGYNEALAHTLASV